jgi:POLQ-like helicase
LTSEDEKVSLRLSVPDLITVHKSGSAGWQKLAQRLARRYAAQRFTEEGLLRQFEHKANVLGAIESFLLAHWDEESDDSSLSVESLAAATLAFHLANAEQRGLLVEMFERLAENINEAVPDLLVRRVFARSLFGLADSVAIRQWVEENVETLTARTTTGELLGDIWPLFRRYVRNKLFVRCDPSDPLFAFAQQWTEGSPFHRLLEGLINAECRFGNRNPTVENVVELGENAFGFQGMLVVGAVAEMLELVRPGETNSIDLIRGLQKEIKYGLPSGPAIGVYELGFADRVLAQQIAARLGGLGTRRRITEGIVARENAVRAVLSSFPQYFSVVLDNLLA